MIRKNPRQKKSLIHLCGQGYPNRLSILLNIVILINLLSRGQTPLSSYAFDEVLTMLLILGYLSNYDTYFAN